MNIKQEVRRYALQSEYKLHQAALSLRGHGRSNFAEDQLLRRFIAELLPAADHSRTVVDIGAGDGTRQSNTFALVRAGWKCIGVEYDSRKFSRLAKAYKHYPNAFACRCRVTPFNVTPLLEAYGIEKGFDVLSLDIDSYDYWMLDALLPRLRPRLVIAEINEKIPPPIKFVVKYDPDFEMTHHFYGFSIASLATLCEQHGYAVLALEYNNVFLADKTLPGVAPLALTIETAYRQGYAERADRREKFRQNHDMEILHTLSPAEGVRFLTDFYARHEGEYELSIG